MSLVNERKWRPAAELLEEAIREDPQFALALVYAAHCYSNLGQVEAASHYEAAFRLSAGVVDRERLFILGSYYERFLHDDRRALATYQALTRLYPDDYWSINNSMTIYGRLGMSEEELEAGERLVALRPNDPTNRNLLVLLFRHYKRVQPDQAKSRRYKEHLRRWRKSGLLSPSDAAAVDSLLDLEGASDRWWAGDVKGSAQEVARVSSDAVSRGDDRYTFSMSIANLVFGRTAAARSLCGLLRDSTMRSECLLRVAYASGDQELGQQQLRGLRSSGVTKGSEAGDALLAAFFGEIALARTWMKPTADANEGVIAMLEGRPLADRPPGRGLNGTHWLALWYRMTLATILDGQGRTREAIAQIKDDTRPAVVAIDTAWPWPQCRMKLAELYRKDGQPEEAAKVEDEIRHYLSEADANHPVLSRLRGLMAGQANQMH
jgi:tetratricopeptide (TPR) repeat protein